MRAIFFNSLVVCCLFVGWGGAETFENYPLAAGIPRLIGQPWKLDEIPAELKGATAVVVPRGPSDRPGHGFTVQVEQPSAVYIGVHRRGQPELPDRWKRTGLMLTWNGFADDVYVTLVEAGDVSIPNHTGQAGLFGVPHIAIISQDLDTARQLIASPKPPPTQPARPAELRIRIEDDIPGLYAIDAEPLRWRFQVYRKSAQPVDSLEVTIRPEADDAEPIFKRTIGVTHNFSEIVEVSLPERGLFVLEAAAPPACKVVPFKAGIASIAPPTPPSAKAPWGVMRASALPHEAALARRLGVSWLRHTTWATGDLTFHEDGTLTADFAEFVAIARAYHEQGIQVMADIQMIPRELSSQPDAMRRVGDAGPLHVRVAPRDWGLWESYVEQLVRQCGSLVQHWEIGNEPNTPHHYWAGTVEEFALFVRHTGTAIRRVKPEATIIFAGFTLNPDGPPYLDRLLELGCGEFLDVLSIHSLYGKARTVDDMQAVLAKHGLREVPMWSTEPKHELPIRNFAAGIQVNMHFLLTAPGAAFYSQFRNLSGRDGTATRAGVIYANAARLIGDAAFVRQVPTGTADAEAGLFQRDGDMLLAVSGEQGPREAVLVIEVEPIGNVARYVSATGQALPLQVGRFEVPLDQSGFVVGAKTITVVESRLPAPAEAHGIVVTAKDAELVNGFQKKSDRTRPSYAAVWTEEEHPALRFPFSIEEAGTYEVYSVVQWAERGVGHLVSPFSWWIDDRPRSQVRQNLPMHWRDSTRTHLRFSPVPAEITDTALGRQLHKLGVVRHLKPGEHHLTVQLDAPRTHDQHFNMEIEMIVLRPNEDDLE